MMEHRSLIHGVMGEFETPEQVLAAAEAARAAGYKHIEAYTPIPVEGLAEAVGFRRPWVNWITLAGGIGGGLTGFGLQYWCAAITYPMNIAGRPLNSWPAFIPVTFEMTILFAAAAAVFGMLAMNGLPTPYHPVFNVPRFALASRDRFFLCIKARDPMFEVELTRKFMLTLSPREVTNIDP